MDFTINQHLKAVAAAADFFGSLDLNQAQRLVEVQESLETVSSSLKCNLLNCNDPFAVVGALI